MRHVVISFLGDDKPGLVEQLATIIKRHKGNWQTSSMRHLSGCFAGILEVMVAKENAQALIDELSAFDALDMHIKVAEPVLYNDKKIAIDITANDRPGIIGDISAVIHKSHGNLVKLVSSQGNAPHFGQPIFKASLLVAINTEQHLAQLIGALEDIEDDLIVDVNI
ncbi:ACT domain-containing protein [Thalassotalea ponticola]|uniref:glycine cleavage system protein R n=1 Tax=Thalassotalea ponticola TaxID=1523392 RepID=UPI0025B33F0F|nr:ACT domain-containing protein [Thalassotalea ponticola]MDN3651777.1 ACT domain-containing protein [Thalassotalea ponticola]